MNEQDTKNGILRRIKNGKPPSAPRPKTVPSTWDGDPVDAFIQHLLAFDGRAAEFKTRAQAVAWLQAQPEMDASKNLIYSTAEGVAGNVAEADLADLRYAHKINVCVAEGEMGVGEMGAIWVTDESLGHAVCALLARRLFILLDSKRIAGGLHEAYARIDLRAHQYGSFFSGPSATADIEAVHITGAQGPLGLTALLYNRPNAPDAPLLLVNPNADVSVWTQAMEHED